MKNRTWIYLFLVTAISLVSLSCASESSISDTSQNFQRGLTGNGQLEERSWEDIEVYQD